MRLVSVAVPIPLLPPLTYSVPDGMELPERGSRVRVHVGARAVIGCVVENKSHHESKPTRSVYSDGIRNVVECLDTEAFLPPQILDLALWVAEYYACGPGESIAAAMPPLTFGQSRRTPSLSFRNVRIARATGRGREGRTPQETSSLGFKQRKALELLAGAPDGLDTFLLARQGVSSDTLKRLVRRGFVSLGTRRIERDPLADTGTETVISSPTNNTNPRRLTVEQREAVNTLSHLIETDEFHVALLHGVTGSGKTEVYVRIARTVCGRGRRVLVLVPEISLTPALVATFGEVFHNRIAIQHSGLSDGERHDQWHRIRRGEVDVVVGTRSAVFAPLDNLGLIVVDEEHDTSYKQEESPRYHGRDVAVVRGQRANALVLLGSATPSMESYLNARVGRYQRVVLSQRVHNRPLATVRVVDMRKEIAKSGTDVVLSAQLVEALATALGKGEQALILLNRRGFATAVLCRQCGQTLECPNCSVSLTLHQSVGRARCHYCNYAVVRPKRCSYCAGPYLEMVGFGTERIEREINELWPNVSVARMDRDTVRRRGAARSLLSRFAKGDIQVLVGTQMIAKGHDFPKVTVVGVISADVGLGMADFRVAERTFQLLTQVAGRAGRGDKPGEAIVQSLYPDHYSINYACQQAYEPFFDDEIRFRTGMRSPPVVSMVNAVVRGRTSQDAMTNAARLAGILRTAGGNFSVLGPAQAPIARLRGQHLAQVFLKGDHRSAMREGLRKALEGRPELRRRVTIDVDPLNVL